METTLPRLFRKIVREHPDLAFQMSRFNDGHFEPTTYKDAYDNMISFAGGLLSIGVQREEHIGLISDNRKEWQQADMGLLMLGAIVVPRGCDATIGDLEYILSFAECKIVIVENSSQVNKIIGIKDKLPLVTTLIEFDEPSDKDLAIAGNAGLNILSFTQIIEKGRVFNAENPNKVDEEMEKGKWDDLATIIFTSGTTGLPKGVQLTHDNYIAQCEVAHSALGLMQSGDVWLTVLPVWHSFERAFCYMVIALEGGFAYSKPVASVMLQDMNLVQPQWMNVVPRLFEAVAQGLFREVKKQSNWQQLHFK